MPPGDFDSYKDFIARASLNSPLSKKLTVSSGFSYLNGGILQNTKYQYHMGTVSNNKTFVVDSNLTNIGKKDPRTYYGVDAQLRWKHKNGSTEIRGEYCG